MTEETQRKSFPRGGERKDITLRGVDKELYDQFVILAKKRGSSIGTAFSHIILWSLKKRDASPKEMFGRSKHHRGRKPEVIEDIEKLVVSKEDLTAAGKRTKFLFKNIGKLIFDKTVDNETLVKHVLIIIDSKVEFPEEISKVIQLGLIRKERPYSYPENEEELKDITIRNVIAPIYDEFLAEARKDGKKTGEYFSELLAHMSHIIIIGDELKEQKERHPLIISFEEELKVVKSDLQYLKKRGIIFYKIQKLEFKKDIDKELFLETITKIINCKKVILPANIPRLILLSRIKNSEEIKTN